MHHRLACIAVLAACTDPAAPAQPWPTCDGDPRATAESLATKAAIYDERLAALHVTAQKPWVNDVAIAPGVDPEIATSADVTVWRSSENDGLWTGLAIGA